LFNCIFQPILHIFETFGFNKLQMHTSDWPQKNQCKSMGQNKLKHGKAVNMALWVLNWISTSLPVKSDAKHESRYVNQASLGNFWNKTKLLTNFMLKIGNKAVQVSTPSCINLLQKDENGGHTFFLEQKINKRFFTRWNLRVLLM